MNFRLLFQQVQQRTGPGFGAGPRGVARLMKRLGDPQTQYPAIHVAGTNGKGSVCYLCAAALQAAGRRTGLFVSPHVFSAQERIQLNGRPISQRAFARLCQTVLAAEKEPLNFFEIMTAAALLYFAEQKVDYAVLETGLGGRKDPTTLCRPAVTLITSVGLDHCALLGHSVEKIAREKAGIIKPGVPVFYPPLPLAAQVQIRRRAQDVQAPLHRVCAGQPFRLQKISWKRGCLLLQKGQHVWPLALLGEKQVQNACLVYQACRFLSVPEHALKQAFASVRVPCRFEICRRGRKTLIFDGAHNPQAIEGLMRFFHRSPWTKQAVLVCGFMQDKDYASMCKRLAPSFKRVYLTQPPGPRAARPEAVYEAVYKTAARCFLSGRAQGLSAVQKGNKVSLVSAPWRALDWAEQDAAAVLITGSFYLVGYLRARKGLTENSDCD